jgi:hypothetical protein
MFLLALRSRGVTPLFEVGYRGEEDGRGELCRVISTSGFMPPSMATFTSDTVTAAATLRKSITATAKQNPWLQVAS